MKVSINRISATRLGLVAAVAGLLFTTPLSAQEKQKEKEKKSYQKDFDKELESLDRARINMDKHPDFDMKKIEMEIKRAMQKVDMEKARIMADDAIRKIDFDQIERQIAESMDKVAEAKEHISKETHEKVKEAMEKAKHEFNEQKRFNQKHIEEQLENAKKEIEKSQEHIKLSQIDLQRSLKEAAKGIEEAKKDLKNYQDMIYAMEADGLLDTQKDYTVSFIDSRLTINGNEQPNAVTDRYIKYFKKDDITISKENGKLNISHKK